MPETPFHTQVMTAYQALYDNKFIWFFVLAVTFDIITGFIKSIVTKGTNSTKGLDGLIKHSLLMLIALTAYPVAEAAGFKIVGDMFITSYAVIYVVSIIENLGQMGIPIPAPIKKYIYKLSDEYNKEDIK
ncbi:MAG: phage holin family protein [Bacteroidaceae bacterium]|nr:phage holin family protein [Bacteroidaceae bacterium]